jgi:hypothetical protein
VLDLDIMHLDHDFQICEWKNVGLSHGGCLLAAFGLVLGNI